MTSRAADRVLAAAVALVGIACAAGLYRIVATIGAHVPFDSNEGWNAYHATAAMTTGSPYPAPASYMIDNYPPLSFYIVGSFGRTLGDMIVAGRVVSLASFVAISAAIMVALRIMACTMFEAAFGALMFGACLLLNSNYVGMDDPQMLGHAIAMGGLLLVLREPRATLSLVVAAFLFALAFFVKHNLIVLPVAATLWLAIYDRRSAARLAAAGIAFFVLGMVLFRLVYGFSLLDRLHSPRVFAIRDLVTNLSTWLEWGLLPLAAAGVLLALRRGDRFAVFVALYAFLGFVIGASYFGGAGVDVNAMFDADIALALVAGLALSRFHARTVLFAGTLAAFLLPLSLCTYLAYTDDWLDKDYWLYPLYEESVMATADIDSLRSHDGPALCETLAYCYWAGKPAAVDVFNTGQEFATGTRNDAELVRMIEAHRFAALQFDTLSPFALGMNVRRTVLRAYRLDHRNDDGVFMIPR